MKIRAINIFIIVLFIVAIITAIVLIINIKDNQKEDLKQETTQIKENEDDIDIVVYVASTDISKGEYMEIETTMTPKKNVPDDALTEEKIDYYLVETGDGSTYYAMKAKNDISKGTIITTSMIEREI